jgi:multidrug efflux pump subunit AcrB
MRAFGNYLRTVPEVRDFTGFAGLASPMDFNGMVRHYYLRTGSNVADIRVTLADRLHREQQSHELTLRLRDDLERIASELNIAMKIVETPPGPPVISTVTVELYGEPITPYETLEDAAGVVMERMRKEPFVVDIDSSVEADQRKMLFSAEKEKAALSGISTDDVVQTVGLATYGMTVSYLQQTSEANPLPIRLQFPLERRNTPEDLLTVTVKGRQGIVKQSDEAGLEEAPQPLVSLGEIGDFIETTADKTIYHKNLRPVVYVFADTAGRAPADAIQDMVWDMGLQSSSKEATPLAERTYLSPGGGIGWSLPHGVRAEWGGEGEWKITIRVFRDLGIAFAAALVGIFIVLVIQTRSAMLAVIIMLAIPLTMIGIMPGFWLLNNVGPTHVGEYANPSFFTATAMIGMIALAGIVVRNSLILVEFIHQALKEGMELEEALVQAGAIRMRPVFLTAGTTLLGNIVITLDPIFNGLAWSIIFGITASTIFTLGVIPVVYYLIYHNVPGHGVPPERPLED